MVNAADTPTLYRLNGTFVRSFIHGNGHMNKKILAAAVIACLSTGAFAKSHHHEHHERHWNHEQQQRHVDRDERRDERNRPDQHVRDNGRDAYNQYHSDIDKNRPY
jgi:hypothetical protein